MVARIYTALVVFFWLATMSWLVVTKILPPLIGGQPPDYAAALSVGNTAAEPVCWRISWNDRRVGTAASLIRPRSGGGTALRQLVHFERLPIEAMLSESFGVLGGAVKGFLGGNQKLEVDMLLATEIRFDVHRQFTDFQTVVDLGDLPGFVRVRGETDRAGKLKVSTRLGAAASGSGGQVLHHELQLPPKSLVQDGFAPRPELRNLQVGQKWTIPVYRPFPPNSPVQIVEAIAERLDVIVWDGRDVETILVEYREEAGSGLHATREPVVREWVRSDGTVLQQEMRISGLKVLFERMASPAAAPFLEKLDGDKHPRLWSSGPVPSAPS